MVEVRFERDTWEGLFANVTEHQKRLIREAVKADLNDYQEANDGGLPLMGRQRFCAKGCSFPNGMLWVVYIPLRLSLSCLRGDSNRTSSCRPLGPLPLSNRPPIRTAARAVPK